MDNQKQRFRTYRSLFLQRWKMIKVLRKRISNITMIILTVAIGLVTAGAISLTRPLPEYLVANEVLIPGQRIDIESFALHSLDLGEATGQYVDARDAPDSFYLSEIVMEGELIPTRKILETPTRGMTTIVLDPAIPVSQKVIPGSWVQIWRATPSAQGYLGELLVSRSQVVAVTEDSSFITREGSLVEILLSQQQAAILLETLASETKIYVLVSP